MTKSDIYEIAIKILGFYLVTLLIIQFREVLTYVTVLMQAQNNPGMMGNFNQTPILIATVCSFFVLVAFTWLLLFKTKKVTKLVCKKEDFEEPIKFFTDKKTIYEIALTIVGLLTIILTLPDFAYRLKNHIQSIQNDFSTESYDRSFLVIAGLKILIGILIIIYSKTISSYFSKDKING
ncbi:hypothetical protein [Albibacterium bauzanense]|uniref:Uncharacterized protein n=1 Tax=Albibacterium bauzanense TaxID=653929 RepID=A0A4R1LQR6_9SPHI|nr:hypothetical protein [Albibacterium bauzanense]TCK80827.1 hypothetical protein C8N28_2581 [Albibacterium bauzanense]